MNDMHSMISCDEDEIFVLTSLGWHAMSTDNRRKNKVGRPVKGFEMAIYEYWYVAGYYEKINKDGLNE